MDSDKKGARSVKGQVLGDNLNFQINLKWLLQLLCLVCIAVYAFWTIESRIQALERNMDIAMDEIAIHEQERVLSQQQHIDDMEERMMWYEQELSINPFSWGKKKK